MTAFEAPIFLAPIPAREWVIEQSLDEVVYLYRVDRVYTSDGETTARWEFHNTLSARELNDDVTVVAWELLEGWH
jgi:hypothetical protein